MYTRTVTQSMLLFEDCCQGDDRAGAEPADDERGSSARAVQRQSVRGAAHLQQRRRRRRAQATHTASHTVCLRHSASRQATSHVLWVVTFSCALCFQTHVLVQALRCCCCCCCCCCCVALCRSVLSAHCALVCVTWCVTACMLLRCCKSVPNTAVVFYREILYSISHSIFNTCRRIFLRWLRMMMLHSQRL